MSWFTHIDPDLLEWELARWSWLTQALSSDHAVMSFRLVTPTPEDFPVSGKTPDERVVELFQHVKNHMGLSRWPCSLERFEEVHDVMRDALPVLARPESSKGAAGLFEVTEKKKVVIHYKPEQLNDPMSMVATMAHELSHYVLATVSQDLPGDRQEHEPLTDLTAVFFGFGIFLANSSFRFSQWQDSRYQGWSTKRQGYLSEQALSLALALFSIRTDGDPKQTAGWLSTNPRHYFKAYHRELRKKHADLVEKLRMAAHVPDASAKHEREGEQESPGDARKRA